MDLQKHNLCSFLVRVVGSSGLGIIKREVELIINESLQIKKFIFLSVTKSKSNN